MNIKFAVVMGIIALGLVGVMSLGRASEPWEREMYPCRYLGVAHWCQDKDDKVEFYMRTVTGDDGRLVVTLSPDEARNSAD